MSTAVRNACVRPLCPDGTGSSLTRPLVVCGGSSSGPAVSVGAVTISAYVPDGAEAKDAVNQTIYPRSWRASARGLLGLIDFLKYRSNTAWT